MVRNKSKYFDSIEAKVVEKNISTDHCLPVRSTRAKLIFVCFAI